MYTSENHTCILIKRTQETFSETKCQKRANFLKKKNPKNPQRKIPLRIQGETRKSNTGWQLGEHAPYREDVSGESE
jgi:hypothetical protein